jgi:hypothetical protein
VEPLPRMGCNTNHRYYFVSREYHHVVVVVMSTRL